MAQVTAASFIAQASSAAVADAQKQAAIRQDYARQRRVTAECSASWASLLLGIARIDSCIEGFPQRVSVARENGHMAGWELVKTDGKWGVSFKENDLSFHGSGPASDFQTAQQHALRALGVPVSAATMDSMAEVAGWSGYLSDTLESTLPLLPDHVVRSLAANTTLVLKDMGLSAKEAPVFLPLLWRAVELFPEAPPEAHDRVPDVLSRAVSYWAQNSNQVISILLQSGSAPSGRRPPDVEVEIASALRNAVSSQGSNKVGLVKALLKAGGDAHAVDTMDQTLLHALAEKSALQGKSVDVEVARLLLAEGVNLEARDFHGLMAHDILRGRLEEAGNAERETSALLELMDPRAPAPKFR